MHTEASFDFPCPHCEKVTKLTMRAGGPPPREMVADVVTVSPDFSMDVGTAADLPPDYVHARGRIMHGSQIAQDRDGQAAIRWHPAGGWLLAHPEHPLRWFKTDGTIEEVKP